MTTSITPPTDIEALNQLAYRYAFAVDTCDADMFVSVFAPDARIRAYNPGQNAPFNDLAGHEQMRAIPDTMRGMFTITMHMMTNHLVEVTGDTATGNVMCTARHHKRDGGDILNIHLRYFDRYARLGGEWKITDRQIRFLWAEPGEQTDTGF